MRRRIFTAAFVLALLFGSALSASPVEAAGLPSVPPAIGGFLAATANFVSGLFTAPHASVHAQPAAVAAGQGIASSPQIALASGRSNSASTPTGSIATPAVTVSATGTFATKAGLRAALDHLALALTKALAASRPAASVPITAWETNTSRFVSEGASGVSLTNLTVNGVTGLAVTDIPDLSANYLSTKGGTITGNLTVTGAFSGGALSLANASTTQISATTAYFGGTATSTFGTDGTLTLTKALGVGSGGTGWGSLAAGALLFGNGSAALATSSNLFWDNTNGRLGIGTTTPDQALAVNGNLDISGSSAYYIGDIPVLRTPFASNGNNGAYTLVGYNAGANVSSSAILATCVGNTTCGANNTGMTGVQNAAFGTVALEDLTTGSFNTAIGIGSMRTETTGEGNSTLGVDALRNEIGSNNNVAIGDDALMNGISPTGNVVIGHHALDGTSTASLSNDVVLGVWSMSSTSITSAASNDIAIGANSGLNITSGGEDIFIGSNTASTTSTGSNNIAIGYDIELPNTTSSNQLDIGNLIFGTGINAQGQSISAGNVGIATTSPAQTLSVSGNGYFTGGLGIGETNTSANTIDVSSLGAYKQGGNTILFASSTNNLSAGGIGALSNYFNTAPGAGETAFGYQALQYATSTIRDTAIGYQALDGSPTISSAGNNTGVGWQALLDNTSGQKNTAVGASAMTFNTTGVENVGVGMDALLDNTTGADNATLGISSLSSNTTGGQNTALGAFALQLNTTGSNNIGIGREASKNNASATSSVAVGFRAADGTAPFNAQGYSALGYQSGFNITTGANYNTLIGYQAGYDITTGANNTIIGSEQTTGSGITTGANNIVIGQGVMAGLTQTGSNQLNIGNLLFGTNIGSGSSLSTGDIAIGTTTPYSRLEVWGQDTASTTAFSVINNASTTVFAVYDNGNATYSGSIFNSSDQRLKTDVASLDASSSLDEIEALDPVSYLRLDQPQSGTNLGFIAQQVQTVLPQLVSTTTATALTPNGTLTLNYTGLIAPMVAAIKALAGEITTLKGTVAGFAQSFTSQKVTTDQLCLSDANGTTCYTRAQLNAVISGTTAPGQGSGGASAPAPAPSAPDASSTPTSGVEPATGQGSPDTATTTTTNRSEQGATAPTDATSTSD